jgi:precorrin-6A/cobalt-precorrin-6A reductase
MPNNPVRILILGGTAEARLLAARLEGDGRYSPLTSLAGVTAKPARIAGEVRTGGFGGVEGLRDFIRREIIALMVDATHPFASQISAHAAQAGAQARVRVLRIERPPWEQQAGDDWVKVADIEQAAQAIPEGARVLVTIGRQEVAPFFAREDIHVIARMIDPPQVHVPGHAQILLAHPPFTREQERVLLEEKHITVLVTKNSGGDATFAKIEAARELGLPVIMVARPEKPTLTTAPGVEDMLKLIEKHFA